MQGLDLSFSDPPFDWWQRRRADGYEVAVINAWTGMETPGGIEAARRKMNNAFAAGFEVGLYVVTVWDSYFPINRAREVAGIMWPHLSFVSLDAEVMFTTQGALEQGVALVRQYGQRPVIYSANWFWNTQPYADVDFGCPGWWAYYDGNATSGVPNLRYKAGLMGKQYQNTTYVEGQAIDRNTFDPAYIGGEVQLTPEEVENFINRIGTRMAEVLRSDPEFRLNRFPELFDNLVGWKVAEGDGPDDEYVGESTRDELLGRIRDLAVRVEDLTELVASISGDGSHTHTH